MLKKIIFMLCLVILFSVPVQSQAAVQDHSEAFVAAQKSFELGLQGSKKDNEEATEKFKVLAEQESSNPIYLAYYGSAITVKSRDAFFPWTKLKLGEQGLDVIDKALKMVRPEHDTAMLKGVAISLGTKLVAVSTFLSMPDNYFHRFTAGKNILAETMKSPVFLTAPTHIQAAFHLKAAVVAQKDLHSTEEIRQLKRALELDPQGKEAGAVQARLKELGK
jgi:hypothetical protein